MPTPPPRGATARPAASAPALVLTTAQFAALVESVCTAALSEAQSRQTARAPKPLHELSMQELRARTGEAFAPIFDRPAVRTPVRESSPAQVPAAVPVKPLHDLTAQEFHDHARDAFAPVFAQPPAMGDWAVRAWATASAALSA